MLTPQPVSLAGPIVSLVPLSLEHLADLEASFAPGVWRWSFYKPWEGDMRGYIEHSLDMCETGRRVAFAVIDKASGRAIGGSSYMDWQAEKDRVEIGYTWYGPQWQRTGRNRACKLLMLDHAFDVLAANRVEFMGDAENMPSRNALSGIGASFEGVLRETGPLPDGSGYRSTFYYSILKREWPEVRAGLVAKINTISGG
jgi:RimJ/RimL family protein N-acetyltransferase